MLPTSWLRSLRARSHSSRKTSDHRRLRTGSTLHSLERLEDRYLLSAVAWTGAGGDFNWQNAANWSTGQLPSTSDNVTIGGAFSNLAITSTSNVAINSITSDATLSVDGATFSVSASSAIQTLDVSGGTVDVDSAAGLNVAGGASVGGTFHVTGSLSLDSYSLDSASAVDGQGYVTLLDQTKVAGTYQVGTTSIPASSNVDFIGAQPDLMQNLTLQGTILGSGQLTVTGLFDWTGDGTLRGSGTLQVPAGGLIDMHGGGAFVNKILDGWTLQNAGTATFRSEADPNWNYYDAFNQLYVSDGAVIDNSGTWSFLGGRSIFNAGQGTLPQVVNAGTMRVEAAAGSTNFDVPLVNMGTVEVDSGAGLNVAGGATFTQTTTGTLNEQIGDTPSGPGNGQIGVAGTVSLAGSLTVQVFKGFAPHMGDQFTIINNQGSGPVNGTFAGLPQGAAVADNVGDLYRISYIGGDGNDVTLTAISSPTTTVVTSDHPAGSTYGQTVTSTATVSATDGGAGTPPGSVQFVVDGENYGVPEMLVGGAATLTLSSLSAGPHTIAAAYTSSSPAFLNSGSDPNFTVSVAPAHLTVTADNQTMVYGGAQPALTYKIAGFVNGETLATSGVSGAPSLSTVTANSHVGIYAITVAVGTLAAANYDFPAGNLVNGSLSITPAMLTVTANNASRLYLATNPTFTDKITGFVNGDTPGVVSGAASLTTTATTASPVGSYPITAAQGTLSASNYTFTFVNGTLTVAAADSVYVLNSSANGAMTIAGNASLKLGGVLQVDSHSSTAIQASGNAAVKATSIQVVGGYAASGNASLSPKPATGAASVPDPLAILPSPSTAGMTNFGALSVGGNTSKTINPGIYSQITVSGNATLTMNAGTYVIEGGGMTVSGNASVSGSGEFIFNAGSGYTYNTTTGTATDGGNFGGITFSGNGKFSLSGPTSGTYAGIVIDQARDNTRAISLGGNATSGITSTIYAANALLTVSGNAQLTGSVVVGTLNASGNVALTQMAAGSDGAGDVAGIADTLLAGNLDVYVDNSSGGFSPDALARIQNAIGVWNALLVPYSESVVQVSDRSLANIVIDSGTTSASGDAGDGVLGCFNSAANEITLLQGWNWYTGADASQIGADQYDFQTTVTHELGHALGLGGANDPNSPMYESLATGVAHRTVSIADLNIPEPPEGADPQMAAGCVDVESAPTANALTSADSQGHDAPVIVVPLNVANGTGRSSNPVAALTQGEILTGKTAIEPPLEFWLDSLAYGALSSPLEKISGASTLRLEGSQTSGPFDTSSSQQHTRAQSDDIGTGPDELFASVFGVTDDNDPGEPCAVPLTCAVDNGLLIVRSVAFLASVMHQRHEHSDAVARRTWSHRGTREASR